MFASKQSRILRQGKELLHSLRKNRVYSRDILKADDLSEVESLEKQLIAALKKKDAPEVAKLQQKILKLGNRVFPGTKWDGWVENVEVFVVAIVIALAIKSYFFQPFKIPTGSMQPTLNGVILTESEDAFPSLPFRATDFVLFGRSYHEVTTRTGGKLDLQATKHGMFTPWFEYTDLRVGQETIRVWVPRQALAKILPRNGTYFSPGATIARFRMDTGDQLLVNRMVYHFRKPKLGEVFVFVTTGIEGIEATQRLRYPNSEGSQFYIKRCTGTPGDTLSLVPPYLLVDGERVTEPPIFQAITSMKNGYEGYTIKKQQRYLKPAGTPYTLPPNGYWAMGDNSNNSEDSRFWGAVPRGNLIGTGFIVYWPFTSHWGWVK